MATTIEVNKSSVKELLQTGAKEIFLIPEYQRPYSWESEQVETLFNDLVEFSSSIQDRDQNSNEASYFLGCIVSYTNDKREQEIIDGQQRLTTLFLLLRAIYAKLESMKDGGKSRTNFMGQIASTLWKIDEITADIIEDSIFIKSDVLESEYNETLKHILNKGEASKKNKDRYSVNYNLLTDLLNKYAEKEPLNFYQFINTILNKTIVLPIKADTQETALTIFATLNDRGLPLSDADIFKAKIYKKLDDDSKSSFVEEWKDISSRAEKANESIQKLFYYYMFYLRAKDKDRISTTPGLRKYFAENSFHRLYDPNLITNLKYILELWELVSFRGGKTESFSAITTKLSNNTDILSTLDILSSYPNEFWKYPVVVYYLQNKDKDNFEEEFLNFLRKLFVNLFRVYVVNPTINAVKTSILVLNSSIVNDTELNFDFKKITDDELKSGLKNLHRNAVRMLLKLLAYNTEDQNCLLPANWEIEHILPLKWQASYFNANEDEINLLIETIGNKIPFEKRLNITASNGYFVKKQEQYKKSKIVITNNLGHLNLREWSLDEIRERNIRIIDKVFEIFKDWDAK